VTALLLAAAVAGATFVPLLQPGDTVPAIPLVTQSARPFSFADLRGNAVVVSFIYTRCPDPRMCPLTTSKFVQLQRELRGSPVQLVEITLDPAYDTPRVLKSYGREFGADPARWTLATGAEGSIDELAARFGVASQWTTPSTLVHTESVIVLDRASRLNATVDGNAWTPEQVRDLALRASGATPSLITRAVLWLGAAVESCSGGRGSITGLEGLALILVLVAGSVTWFLRAFAKRPAPH
jgi:cytochrome oxidase Cu insertion factor (SCO1/SenC/PrrC family)